MENCFNVFNKYLATLASNFSNCLGAVTRTMVFQLVCSTPLWNI